MEVEGSVGIEVAGTFHEMAYRVIQVERKVFTKNSEGEERRRAENIVIEKCQQTEDHVMCLGSS